MVSHVDHTEHVVHIIVTEQGLANLRGLSPRERALEIIKNCAHPNYKNELLRYYDQASKQGDIFLTLLKKAYPGTSHL
jgi:succinyl-CoA:acetate CoA-transferase